MIKQLTLSNFQSHKETKLEFSNGVNVIIGGSDSGKTSIIRALKWLVFNRPGGDAFRSTWGGDTIIDLAVDWKGHTLHVRRIKSDKVNLYQKDGTRYAAFGTEVPNDITELLNLNEINLQAQMDSPFLISSTPGDVAKHFNQIAHLDQIDSGLKKVQQEITTIQRIINFKEGEVERATEELKKFDHLEKFEIDVEVLEDMQNRFLKKVNESRLLKTLIESIETIETNINTQSEILVLEPQLNKVLGWIAERTELTDKQEQLDELIEELKSVEAAIEDHTYIVTAEKPVNDLLGMFVKKAELNDLSQSIGKLISNITHTENALQTDVKGLVILEKEFVDGFVDGICPLCGQTVKKKLKPGKLRERESIVSRMKRQKRY